MDEGDIGDIGDIGGGWMDKGERRCLFVDLI